MAWAVGGPRSANLRPAQGPIESARDVEPAGPALARTHVRSSARNRGLNIRGDASEWRHYGSHGPSRGSHMGAEVPPSNQAGGRQRQLRTGGGRRSGSAAAPQGPFQQANSLQQEQNPITRSCGSEEAVRIAQDAISQHEMPASPVTMTLRAIMLQHADGSAAASTSRSAATR